MVEPSQREVDRALESSMQMFERVQVGEVSSLEPLEPKRLLLALDGSTQDATSTGLAAALRARFAAEVSILAACENHQQVAQDARQTLADATIVPSSGPMDSFEQILTASKSTAAELLIVPCPFGATSSRSGPTARARWWTF